MNALALLAELEAPSVCDNPKCLADALSAKLKAAVAGLHSIIAVDDAREGMIEDYKQRIEIRGGIIDDLKKLDTNNQRLDANSQRIDLLGQQKEDIWKEQHFDDKKTIGELQKDLASCRGNQKWIFAGGSLIGGYLGYKIKGNVSLQNPLILNPALTFTTPQEKARLALQNSFTK